MPKSTIVEIDGIGPVLFERSLRAKHMNISIKAAQGVRVAVPKGVSFHEAGQLIYSKKAWIKKNLVKVKQIAAQKAAISNQLANIDLEKAKQSLVSRLDKLAENHGFSYNKVTIRNQKTKWGSCSSKDNISLNIQLVCLPQELIDYVILHELVHTKVKNHSKDFWVALDKYVGNAKALDSKLSQHMLGSSG